MLTVKYYAIQVLIKYAPTQEKKKTQTLTKLHLPPND